MMSRHGTLLLVVFGGVSAATGYWLGDTYTARLSFHQGYCLVPVRDAVRSPIRTRPRRTLVAVIDGLRLDAALTMRSTLRLSAAGVCARTYVGLPSLSRPSYAVLSTGVEQDRTGARINFDSSPLAAESIWDVAREAGLRVEGRSELPWWRELFPTGFARYETFDATADTFARPLEADLTLVHPVYVDEAAHDHGATSAQYLDAVRRVDGELSRALDGLDLRRDLVVLTADHGHRDRGGHGGAGTEITDVLTCFAGRNVAPHGPGVALDSRAIAPALSMLLGLRFPRHMRAVEDPLDAAAGLVDRDAVGDAYLADRMVAIVRARAANTEQLRAWNGGDGTWSGLYERQRLLQWARALGVGVGLGSVARILGRAALPRGAWLTTLAWGGAVAGVFVAIYAWRSGGLDLTSIGKRNAFIQLSIGAASIALALGAASHGLARGGVELLARRAAVLLAAVVTAHAAHVAAFGWPMGFPLPPPGLFFAPYLMASFQVVVGLFVVFAATAAFVGGSLRKR